MQLKKIRVMFVMFAVTTFTFTTPALAESEGSQKLSAYLDADSKMVLDDLIVYGYKEEDQKSDSVANVLVTKLWKLLGAGEGVAVNVDLPFAPNSSVLTAEGNELMGLIARAIKSLDDEVLFEVQIPSGSKNKLSKARVSSIVAEFNSRYRLNNAFTLNSYSNHNSRPVNTQRIKSQDTWRISRPEIWRATIVNRGHINNNLDLVSQLPNISFSELLASSEMPQTDLMQSEAAQ